MGNRFQNGKRGGDAGGETQWGELGERTLPQRAVVSGDWNSIFFVYKRFPQFYMISLYMMGMPHNPDSKQY